MSANVRNMAVESIGKVLLDEKRPLKERFRALFTLKNLGGHVAIQQIGRCFCDPSELLKHECAFCLGQMQDTAAMPILIKLLKDRNNECIVRHEAGEALGAIGNKDALNMLEEFSRDPVVEVAETCQLAVGRIRWLHSRDRFNEVLPDNPYMSVDPAPPCEERDVDRLKKTLLNENLFIFERYRALFSLRNQGGKDAVRALAEGLNCKSALFRHEIAYVLGQMQDPIAVPFLTENLSKLTEHPMVRHECAEAIGSIGTKEGLETLQKFLKDEQRVVRESCEVALDMSEYQLSDEFQYADGLCKYTAEEDKLLASNLNSL